jgi:hypothetical protein
MNQTQFFAPNFQSAGFAAVAYRRTPEQKAAVAANLAARVAARRDERVSMFQRFGQDVFATFINGERIEGDAIAVMAALARVDRADERVTIRMTKTIDADYAARGVFVTLPVGTTIVTTFATACAMLEDARTRIETLSNGSTIRSYRALIRQLAELTA